MIAVIKIREMMPAKPGNLKFKDTSNKTWNCAKEELIPHFAVGERYTIDYNESSFQGSNGPVTMKWVNKARFWRDGDGDNTWPDKEPYQGGGSYSGNKGDAVKKSDYDPEIGKRQTAANCAMQFFANQGATIGDLENGFGLVAGIVLNWINEKPKSDAGVSGGGSEEDTGSDGIPTEEFGF